MRPSADVLALKAFARAELKSFKRYSLNRLIYAFKSFDGLDELKPSFVLDSILQVAKEFGLNSFPNRDEEALKSMTAHLNNQEIADVKAALESIYSRFEELFPDNPFEKLPEKPDLSQLISASLLRTGYWYAATNDLKNKAGQ